MRSRLESYLFTYTTTNSVQEIIKQTSIQVQIFITMNLNMNNNSNNVHLSVVIVILINLNIFQLCLFHLEVHLVTS